MGEAASCPPLKLAHRVHSTRTVHVRTYSTHSTRVPQYARSWTKISISWSKSRILIILSIFLTSLLRAINKKDATFTPLIDEKEERPTQVVMLHYFKFEGKARDTAVAAKDNLVVWSLTWLSLSQKHATVWVYHLSNVRGLYIDNVMVLDESDPLRKKLDKFDLQSTAAVSINGTTPKVAWCSAVGLIVPPGLCPTRPFGVSISETPPLWQ